MNKSLNDKGAFITDSKISNRIYKEDDLNVNI